MLAARTRACAPTIRQGVVFVIAHHDQRFAGIDHAAGQLHRQADARTTINDIAEKDDLAGRVAIDAIDDVIAERLQQRRQSSAAAVYIADKVIAILWRHECLHAVSLEVIRRGDCSNRAWCDRSRNSCAPADESASDAHSCAGS